MGGVTEVRNALCLVRLYSSTTQRKREIYSILENLKDMFWGALKEIVNRWILTILMYHWQLEINEGNSFCCGYFFLPRKKL